MALPIKPGSFLRHALADVPRWARSLEHVRFCHPADHQVLDREIFEVAVAIPDTEPKFLTLCASLGIDVKRIQPEDTVARAGVRYTPEEWERLKFPIPAFPGLLQPGDQIFRGASAHVRIRGRFLEIVIKPGVGPYSLDESDYRRAKVVDGLLCRPDLQFRDPPRDDDSCVSPKYYPEYWAIRGQ